MSKTRTFKQKVKDYTSRYGEVPDDEEERISELYSRLKFGPSDVENFKKFHKALNKQDKQTYNFTLYLIPEPTPRPRTRFASHVFYVSGAKDNNDLFTAIVGDVKSLPIITTPTEYKLVSYLPTPNSMNRCEKMLAEVGDIPCTSTPDWDNLGKAYCDMIQKNLLLNDSLIWKGLSEKYYSIKPRIELSITYSLAYDCKYNRRKIESSKFYNDMDESKKLFCESLSTIVEL